jgi:hypothetical protein
MVLLNKKLFAVTNHFYKYINFIYISFALDFLLNLGLYGYGYSLYATPYTLLPIRYSLYATPYTLLPIHTPLYGYSLIRYSLIRYSLYTLHSSLFYFHNYLCLTNKIICCQKVSSVPIVKSLSSLSSRFSRLSVFVPLRSL